MKFESLNLQNEKKDGEKLVTNLKSANSKGLSGVKNDGYNATSSPW